MNRIRDAVLPLAAIGILVLTGSKPGAVPKFSDWSAPVNLGPVVNSSAAESGPALSKDSLTLFRS